MWKQINFSEEDKQFLISNEYNTNFEEYSNYGNTAIVRGVANQLGKWPSNLFTAFLAACLIIVGSVLFILGTLALGIKRPIMTNRGLLIPYNETFRNLYFLKHANHSWTKEEFCYLESTARHYPEMNVYLINLTDDFVTNKQIDKIFLHLRNQEKCDKKRSVINYDECLRETLASQIHNIYNIDISTDKFFNGSVLTKVLKNLSMETLEVAGEAYILWNSPGIALKPIGYHHLSHLKNLLCNFTKARCLSKNIAFIEPNSRLLAVDVECQAFIGFLIDEIAKNMSSTSVLTDAIHTFCKRNTNCPEIKILNDTVTHAPNICPVVQKWNSSLL